MNKYSFKIKYLKRYFQKNKYLNRQFKEIKDEVYVSNNSLVMTWSATEYDSDGNVHFIELPRTDLHQKFQLNGRDVRMLVSNYNYPTILSRDKCIIIDINDIHCIVCHDKFYLLRMRDEPLNSDMILEIQNSIKNKKDYSSYSNNPQPFELAVLEVFLERISDQLELDYQKYSKKLKLLMEHPEELSLSEINLTELLIIKNELNSLLTFITELYNSISSLLQSDEDMSNMYLTNKYHLKPIRIDQHEEVEMLLETYYSQLEDTMNRTKEDIQKIKSTQDFLSVTLDSVRNRMMQVELKLSIGAFSISVGTFIAGIFGMNLRSYMEDTPYLFHFMTVFSISFSFFLFYTILKNCYRNGLFIKKIKKFKF